MLLNIKDALLRYGDVTIFENVNLAVSEGEKIGLIGPNGSGKSSLLDCIAGVKQFTAGQFSVGGGAKIGYLRQNSGFSSDKTVYDEMMSVFSRETAVIEEINATAALMAENHADEKNYALLSAKYQKLMREAEVSEAYDVEVKVKTVLNGMNMAALKLSVADTLSGGEKTKAALCKLLLSRPELILLDEPTNHLDYKTLGWLENYISASKSAVIVVSHDRYFLDKVCTTIWEENELTVNVYKGNYTSYRQLKAERDEVRTREFEKQLKETAKLEDYIARNKVRASTANMAKSREKKLAKMVPIKAPEAEKLPPRFLFSYTSEPSETPLAFKDVTFGYDGKTLFEHVSFDLKRGEKLALIGLNGTGKSTLVKLAALTPLKCPGKIIFGKNVRMGYYDQENLTLDGDKTALEQLWFDNTRMSQTEVRALLARFGLRGEEVYKKVSSLSGGEKARLALAALSAKDCNLLILDEPTNHLDLLSREALEDALKNYGGTLFFVSHDRYFVNAVASNVAELENGTVEIYKGNYDDYTAQKAQRAVKAEAPVVTAAEKKQTSYRSPKQRAADTLKKLKIDELEERLNALDARENAVVAEIHSPKSANYQYLEAKYIELTELNKEYKKLLEELDEL